MHEFRYVKFSFKKPENFYAYQKLPMPVPSNKSYPTPANVQNSDQRNYKSNFNSERYDTKNPEFLNDFMFNKETKRQSKSYDNVFDPISESRSIQFQTINQDPSIILGRTNQTSYTDDQRMNMGKMKYLQNYELKDPMDGVSYSTATRYQDSNINNNASVNKELNVEQGEIQYQKQINDLKRVVETLESANQELKAKLELRNNNATNNDNNNSYKKELLEQNKEILMQLSELQKANIQLKTELESKNVEKSREYEYWQVQLDMKESTIAQLERKLTEKKNKLKEYKQEIATMKNGLEEVDSNLSQLFSLKKENEDVKVELERLKKTNTEISSELETKKAEANKIKEYQDRIERLENYINDINKKESDIKDLHHKDSQEIKSMKKQLNQLQTYNKMLEDENNKFLEDQNANIGIVNTLRKLEDENEELKLQLQRQAINYEEDYKDLETKYTKLLNSHQSLKNEPKVDKYYEKALKEKDDKIHDLFTNIDEITAENKKIKEKLHQTVDESKQISKENKSLERELQYMSDALDDREDIIKNKAIQNKELKEKILNLEYQFSYNPSGMNPMNEFLLKVEISRLHELKEVSMSNIQHSIVKTQDNMKHLNHIEQSLLHSKIEEIDKLKAENTRLLEYVDVYKTNTLEMEQKIGLLIDKYEKLRIRTNSKKENTDNKSSINSLQANNSFLPELRELQMKNRVLELENKKLSSYIIDNMKM